MPHDEAVEYIRRKVPLLADTFYRLGPELRARAFTISGVECADTLQRCRDAIATLPSGGDWNAIKKDLVNEICPWLVDPDADTETQARQIKAAKARAELLLRIHGGQAYGAANARVLDENVDIFPYRQYLSMDDSRVRASHAALHNKIVPADSPWWHKHTPPWEFGCRCTVAGISAEEAEEMAAAESHMPPEQRDVLQGLHLTELVENNRLIAGENQIYDTRTPYEKEGKGYEWDHRSFQMPLELLQERYDPPVWQAFEAFAERTEVLPGSTLLDWAKMSGPPRAPQSPGELLAAPKASVPTGIAAKLLGDTPDHPAAKAAKLWGDDDITFADMIEPSNTAPAMLAWRAMMERLLYVLEPMPPNSTLFRGWQFKDEAAMQSVMATLDAGKEWDQKRVGMSLSASMDVALREKFIGPTDKIAVLWIVENAVSPVNMQPIFQAVGTNAHDEIEAIMPNGRAVMKLGKYTMTIKDKSGNDRQVIVYRVQEI